MKSKPFEMCLLFDFYGDLLTDKQKELFDLYYNHDLSLSEIAEQVNITRQGVRDSIVRAEHTLQTMENNLGLVSKYGQLDQHIQEIAADVKALSLINSNFLQNPEISKILARITTHLKALSD